MIQAILGQKITQDQSFTEAGLRIPVTHIIAGPCPVVSTKTADRDGYDALILGFGQKKPSRITKQLLGIAKKAGLDKNPPRFLREVTASDLKVGDIVKVGDVFTIGDKIQVTGVSKGKGFQGVVKRHHFKGGPRTHGQSDRERAPGSIGQTTTPGRVYKGKRMAGRMGNKRTTVKNLKVISIDPEKNLLTIKGLVPGGRNSLLIIQKMI
ncbi:50S ribosomal protein L3 [Candidatus Gottesmanbacteria bacterium]|nr:50S ribosomal protein L3 [Candidatus Gottesmanbacteria bacterium]